MITSTREAGVGWGGKLEAEVDSITQSTQASVSVPRREADALIAEARGLESSPSRRPASSFTDEGTLLRYQKAGWMSVVVLRKETKVYHSVQSFCLDLSTCLRRSKVCHIQQGCSLKLDSSTLPRFSLKHFHSCLALHTFGINLMTMIFHTKWSNLAAA